MIFNHFDWLPVSKYEALFVNRGIDYYLLVDDFSKWPPMNVVLMFYTFGEIKQIDLEKTALIQSQKT